MQDIARLQDLDDLVPAQREKNFAADETGQYWMILLLSLTDPKVLSDAETRAYLTRAHAVITSGLPKKKQKELGLL